MNDVMILGMHRSGTSALAGCLRLCGLHVGEAKELFPPTPANPRGYWENSRLVGINDEVLKEVGASWDSIHPLTLASVSVAPNLEPVIYRARNVWKEISSRGGVVFKDPRLCITWPFWDRVWSEPEPQRIWPAVVVIYRNPVEVAESLAKRNGFPMDLGLDLWRHYTGGIKACIQSRKGAAVVISYDQLLTQTEAALDLITSTLWSMGVQAEVADMDRIKSFLSPTLRHHSRSSLDFYGSRNVSDACKDLHRQMEQLCVTL